MIEAHEICYDKFIYSQEDFIKLYSSPDWLGAKSVAFVGDNKHGMFVKSGGPLIIPPTVQRISGFNNAVILIIANIGVFGYAILPRSNEYSINRMIVVSCKGFINSKNVRNCTAISLGKLKYGGNNRLWIKILTLYASYNVKKHK